MAVEVCDQPLDELRLDDVVAIEEVHVLDIGMDARESGIASSRWAAVLTSHELEAPVSRGQEIGHGQRAVSAAVVDDDAFPRGVRLLEHAIEALPQDICVVV